MRKEIEIAALAIEVELSRRAFVKAGKQECEGGVQSYEGPESDPFVETCLALIRSGARPRESNLCDRCQAYCDARNDLRKRRRRLQVACSRVVTRAECENRRLLSEMMAP